MLRQLPVLVEGILEGNSWRPYDFRRFQIGRLADGREEWLEFWRHNHLLAPFSELHRRREIGTYGGRTLAFLSLPDLIRSKQTERLHDWLDIDKLEEFSDARQFARVQNNEAPLADALSQLRSRQGLELFHQSGMLNQADVVAKALRGAPHPLTQALLLPFAPMATVPATAPPMESVVLERLRATPVATPMHFALIEAVRRQYRLFHQELDRRDKERIRDASQRGK